MHSNLVGLLNLVDYKMPRPYQPFDIECRDRDVSLSDAHFHLQLVYYLIGYVHYLFENVYLLHVARYAHFSTFQEVVCGIFVVIIQVYLSTNFLEQGVVAF